MNTIIYVQFEKNESRDAVEEEIKLLEEKGYVRLNIEIVGDMRRWTLIKMDGKK